MLRTVGGLHGATLAARDGEVGSVADFLFDDATWTIRYLVADTGGWLSERLVLISPHAVRGSDWQQGTVEVDLTREQIENSPEIFEHEPVSRQKEAEYFEYYGYPPYWGGTALWGANMYPITGYPYSIAAGGPAPPTAAMGSATEPGGAAKEQSDPHLRSAEEVKGYTIQALDGEIGHLEDFIVDEKSWAIGYVIVDTGNWLPGKKVVISPKWIAEVSWTEGKVYVRLTREKIKSAPEYEPNALINRDYEERLWKHYGERRT